MEEDGWRIGEWRMVEGWNVEYGGGWRIGLWRMEYGGCKMEDGKMEDEGLKLED